MSDTGTINIFILDDHQILIDGLKSLVATLSNYTVWGTSNNGNDALIQLQNSKVDIVLTDISMPLMDGVTFTRLLKDQNPEIKVIALSMFDQKDNIMQMLDAGVNGYILKNTGAEELSKALDVVASGEYYFSESISSAFMKAFSDLQSLKKEEEKVKLTDREKDVIKLISLEMSNLEIANKLFISERTVETHRKNIFRKTGAKSVIGIVKYAMEHKLINS